MEFANSKVVNVHSTVNKLCTTPIASGLYCKSINNDDIPVPMINVICECAYDCASQTEMQNVSSDGTHIRRGAVLSADGTHVRWGAVLSLLLWLVAKLALHFMTLGAISLERCETSSAN